MANVRNYVSFFSAPLFPGSKGLLIVPRTKRVGDDEEDNYENQDERTRHHDHDVHIDFREDTQEKDVIQSHLIFFSKEYH